MSKDIDEVFIASILCGIIIYICVEAYRKSGAWQVSIIGVPVFILIGAEHSIADVCFAFASKSISLDIILFICVVAIGNAIGSIVINIV